MSSQVSGEDRGVPRGGLTGLLTSRGTFLLSGVPDGSLGVAVLFLEQGDPVVCCGEPTSGVIFLGEPDVAVPDAASGGGGFDTIGDDKSMFENN